MFSVPALLYIYIENFLLGDRDTPTGNLSARCGFAISKTSGGFSPKHLGARPHMASAVARAYSGGVEAEPPAGSSGRAPGQGVRIAKTT